MKTFIRLLSISFLVLYSAVNLAAAATTDSLAGLDAMTIRRLQCPDWRVRYCLTNVDNHYIGTPSDRVVLERLIRDPHEGVANQAAVIYLSLFVSVDKEYLRDHVKLFYRLPIGAKYVTPPDVQSVQFHRDSLRWVGKDGTSPGVADNIQVIGIIGDESDIDRLRPFLNDKNVYIAQTTAIALARLGSKADAIATLQKTVNDPLSDENAFYHIDALRFLAQLDARNVDRDIREFADRVRNDKIMHPRHWWQLTQIAWSRGLEINDRGR